MREVTAEELATWLGELPEEARPKSTAGYALETGLDEVGVRWWRLPMPGEDNYVYVGFPVALALWFTAATLWLVENSHAAPRIQKERDDLWHVYDTLDAFCKVANYYYSGSGPTPYHALAAAVRRVRAEEGKR